MEWYESSPAIGAPQLSATQLWVIAILCFGIGDVATTSIGISLAGAVETHPFAAQLFQHSILGAMVLLKSLIFVSCYALWKRAPQPHCIGVPLGLAALGVLVTGWNVHILVLTTIS